MVSFKAEQIKSRLLEFCCLMSFNYRGVHCDIDPFNPRLFHVMCGNDEQDDGSIEEVMESPLFAGACLNDIADEIEILEW